MAKTLILFGDGLQALYYDEKIEYLNREGNKVKPLLVVPSEELKNKYNLKHEDLNIQTEDGKLGIWMEFPTKQILWLNKSRSGAVLLVMCAFNQSTTQLMGYYDELLQWDEHRDRTEARLRAQVSALSRELEDVTSNQAELMRRLNVLREISSENIREEEDE